jgi:hypothetical protein
MQPAAHPFGYFNEGKIYLSSFLDYPDRLIGFIKKSETDTIRYFEDRFKVFESKVNELFDAIHKAENKASYLEKLHYFKSLIGSHEALGDFKKVYYLLVEKEAYLNALVSNNRVKNLEAKRLLLDEMYILKDSSDWLNALEKIKEVKSKWIRIGIIDKEHKEEIDGLFQEYSNDFFKRRRSFFEEKAKMNKLKLEKYASLVKKAEEMRDNIDIKKTVDEYKKIVEEWKKIGPVPKKELNSLQKKFKNHCDYFFNRIKQAKAEQTGPPQVYPAGKYDPYERMRDEVFSILHNMPPNGDEIVRKLIESWKKLPIVIRTDEFKKIEFEFKSTCTRIIDIYFVNRIAYKRFPDFKKLSPREKLKIQIGVLKELIERDSEQIENFENSFSKADGNSADGSYDKVFGSKLLSQKRNLESKKNLLAEMQVKFKF